MIIDNARYVCRSCGLVSAQASSKLEIAPLSEPLMTADATTPSSILAPDVIFVLAAQGCNVRTLQPCGSRMIVGKGEAHGVRIMKNDALDAARQHISAVCCVPSRMCASLCRCGLKWDRAGKKGCRRMLHLRSPALANQFCLGPESLITLLYLGT
jgi:hypothetical protein